MRTRRRIRWLSPLLLFFLALGAVGGWQINAALGPSTPTASGATGACAPALSTLASSHLEVPTGVTATLTATCENVSGPVAGRTIVLQQSGGYSSIIPASAVTDAQGQAVFKVKDSAVAGPITYTAVDKAAGSTFDQVVQVRFVSGAASTPVPVSTIGLFGVAAIAAFLLAVLQVWRRRRAPARVRHVS